jgi:Flp pilus assembly protein TadG
MSHTPNATGRQRRWRVRAASDAGGALVELAVALPLLVLVLAGTIDFARVFYTAMAVTGAARAGAQYGAYSPARSGDTTAMETTALNATSTTGMTASASRYCQCADDNGGFSATATANDCSSPTTTSCPGKHLVVTVTVTTTKVFSTIMGALPSGLRTINLSRSATMRVNQ